MNALDTSRWREKRGVDEVQALDTLDKTLAMKNPYGVVNPTSDWSTQMSRDFPDASIGGKLDTSKVADMSHMFSVRGCPSNSARGTRAARGGRGCAHRDANAPARDGCNGPN